MSNITQFLSYSSVIISLAGNTSGTLAPVSTGTLLLAGGNNVTLSQVGNAVTISAGAGGGGGSFSAGLSNLGNTAGSTGVTGTRLVLVGSNNISLSQSTDANGGTISFSANNRFSAGMSNLGNTSGTTGMATGGRIVIVGGNNVTISQSLDGGGSSATLTISAFNQTSQSNTAGMSNLGNTSGTSGVISGPGIQLLFAGGNNVTLSQSVNASSATITISAFNQTSQSNTLGMSNLGNTSGTSGVISGPGLQYIIAGGNNITLSQSINGSSGTITISAFTQSAESQTAGISNLGNTSGTSGVASGAQVRLLFAGGNNVTLSQSVNGASATITVSAFNQTAQPSSAFSAGISTQGNTAGSTGLQSSQLLLVGGNNITLSGSTAAGGLATVTISAFNEVIESHTFGMSNLGNTSGTSGVISGSSLQMILAGGNNITLSQSINGSSATITISAPPAFSAGVSNSGNTAGSTGATGSRLVFVGTNNITLSQSTDANGGTISFSGNNRFSAGMSNLGNTSGSTGMATGGRILIVGGNNITISQSLDAGSSSATLTVSAANQTYATVSYLAPGGDFDPNLSNRAILDGTVLVQPIINQQFLTADRAVFWLSNSMSSSSNSSHAAVISMYVGIYTMNASTLSMATSGSTNYQYSNTSNNSFASITGLRLATVPITLSMTPGNYWAAVIFRSSTTNANWATFNYGAIQGNSGAISNYGIMLQATASSVRPSPALGYYSVTSGVVPPALTVSNITGATGSVLPHFILMNGTF